MARQDGRRACRTFHRQSWTDPRIEIRGSRISGNGSFATAPIAVGEVVVMWGGRIVPIAEVAAGRIRPGRKVAIAEDVFLVDSLSRPPGCDHFLNHSCDPNLWMVDEVSLATRRAIRVDEELVADYAMWEYDETFIARWRCCCGSPLCRGRLTGKDWRLPALQASYDGHFSPFINARIEHLARHLHQEP